MHDLRVALRDLRRHPIFAVTVVLTIGIGIAATTAAFALLNVVFFVRLPVHDQDRLVTLWATDSAHGRPESPLPWDTRDQLARRNGAFVDLAAVRAAEPWPYVAREGTRTVRLGRTAVGGNFFELLGVRPELGRLLRPADDIPAGPDLVVLSDQLWRRAFAADSNVIGRQLTFEGGVYQVIGVAPPEFSYPNGTDAWTPVARELHNRWNASPDDWTRFWFGFIARLRPGATLSSATTELQTVLQLDSASGKYGRASSGPRLPSRGVVERYTDVVIGKEVRPAVGILFGAVALVLIIACTNIAGLFLARGIARAPELSVRATLGAGRGHLVAHLLAQPAILVLTAGFLGAIGSVALVRGAVALAPPELPMLAAAHVDARVVAFAAAMTTAVLVACALAPARRSARSDAGASLRTNTRSITGGRVTGFVRRALVAAQVALGLVVLSSAGQLSTTLAKLLEAPFGFDPTHLLFFTLDQTPWPVPSSPDSLTRYFDRWDASFDRLTQLMPDVPGFCALTTTLRLPFNGMPATPYTVDGREASGSASAVVPVDWALDNYFRIMGVPVLRGRPFTREDSKGAPLVAVVSASFAQQEWPGQDAIGHRIRLVGDSADRWRTIVGVVGDSRYGDIGSASAGTVYLSARQTEPGAPWYVVRTRGDPRKAIPLLEHTIQEADPAFGATRVTTGPDVLASRLSRLRVLTTLLTLLSVTALLLAATGLFGVLSAYVRERRRDLGVRAALGASPTQLRALVLSQTVSMGIAGVVCGIPLAIATAHVLHILIPDAQPIGVLTLLAIAAVLIGVLGAATYMPTVRAARVEIRETLAAE